MTPILHICEQNAWEIALDSGIYQPDSLLKDGFIHASKPDQVLRVANNFFFNRFDLILLWIDPDLVHPEIRWESPAENLPAGQETTNEVFPHIYGALNLNSVFKTSQFLPDEDGWFRNLPG